MGKKCRKVQSERKYANKKRHDFASSCQKACFLCCLAWCLHVFMLYPPLRICVCSETRGHGAQAERLKERARRCAEKDLFLSTLAASVLLHFLSLPSSSRPLSSPRCVSKKGNAFLDSITPLFYPLHTTALTRTPTRRRREWERRKGRMTRIHLLLAVVHDMKKARRESCRSCSSSEITSLLLLCIRSLSSRPRCSEKEQRDIRLLLL